MSIARAATVLGLVGLLVLPGTAAYAAPSTQDTAYLQAAHQANLAEIAGGNLAQQKGQNQQVKNLGARFVADHTTLDAALTQTAQSLGVTLPNAPNADQQALAARYQAASGSSFDTLFVSTQMDAHMQAMQLGQTEISTGTDASVKKAAQDAAPVVASHETALQSAARALGLPTNIGTGTGGQAAHHGISTTAIAASVLGLVLVIGALVLLRRRPRPARG